MTFLTLPIIRPLGDDTGLLDDIPNLKFDVEAGTVTLRLDVILGMEKSKKYPNATDLHAGPRNVTVQIPQSQLLKKLGITPLDLTDMANDKWYGLHEN